MVLALSGCASYQEVKFANRQWHISDYYGQIIDRDTTWRMTFGEVLIPEDLAIISCADSAAMYPGMEKYIASILKTAGLENDEVLFYSPSYGKMFVRLLNEPPATRPASLWCNLTTLILNDENERPIGMWTAEEDVENWHRQPDQMYTYTYFDMKNRRVIVVDYYDYGTTPIAQISITQSWTKTTDRMNLPNHKRYFAFTRHDLKDYRRDIEFWSHYITSHRENALNNYRIGQEQLNRLK